MNHLRITAALVLLLALPRPASAAPSDITVELSQPGLTKVGNELKALIPDSISWPDLNQKLFGCPFSSKSAFAALSNGQASVQVANVQVSTSANLIKVDLSGKASGNMDASFQICIGGTTKCKVSFSASHIGIHAEFTPAVVNGALALVQPKITLDLPDSTTQINVSSCGLADVANQVISDVRSVVFDRLDAWIQTFVIEKLEPLLRKTLGSFSGYSGTFGMFKMNAGLSDVLVTSSLVRANASFDISAATLAKDYCAVGDVPAPTAPATLPDLGAFNEHIGMAISTRTATRALHALWRAGWLCFDEARMKQLNIDKTFAAAGLLLGVGTVKSIRARVPTAPTLRSIGGAAGELVADAPFEVEITTDGNDGEGTIMVLVPVQMRGNVVIDPLTSGLRLDVKSMTSGTPTITAKNAKVPDAKKVIAALDSMAFPSARTAISNRTLIPQVLSGGPGAAGPLGDVFLLIKRRANSTEYVRFYGELFSRPKVDTTPPTTSLASAPPALTSAKASYQFVASGSDTQTPSELLRYSWRVDGGDWSQPVFGSGNELSLGAGSHVIEVKAIDLNDNEDGSPVRYTLEVDTSKPKVSIANKPADTIKASSLSIDVNVSDDRSAPSRIAVQLVLQQVVSGKLVDIEQRPFAAGTTRFELAGLANAEYRVELIARDEAGNLSEAAQARFTVDAPPPSPGAPSTGSEQPGVSRIAGGCSAAPASEPSWLALLLLLLVATLAVRRRRGSRR